MTSRGIGSDRLDESELQGRIDSFPRWHYRFDLRGHATPIWDESRINRHTQRRGYFFDPFVRHLGGSLAGKRVLDLGCNAGFWSLAAAESGCEFVLGVDGRQMHVDQAQLVFEAKEIDSIRYEFVLGDLFEMDWRRFGRFDVVLCLGLLYHVNKPVELLERIASVNDDLLVIDTNVSKAPGSFLEFHHESVEDPRNTLGYDLTSHPTKAAVYEMVRLFGYDVVTPKARFSDYTGASDYRDGRRKAFICSRRTSLDGFPGPIERDTGGSLYHKLVRFLLRHAPG